MPRSVGHEPALHTHAIAPPRLTSPPTIRIIVADEQAIDREGLAALLEQQAGLSIVGRAASSAETVELCRELRPDALLVDSRLPDLAGIPVITAVRAAAPETKILAIADHSEGRCQMLSPPGRGEPAQLPDWLPCALRMNCLLLAVSRGALGAIRRSATTADLVRAVRAVASGAAWLEAATASHLLGALPAAGAPDSAGAPSVRDLEVAAFIAEGRSNKEIACAMGVGEPTVKKHVGRMLECLGLEDRLQLGLYVARHPQILQRIDSLPRSPLVVGRAPRLRS